MHLSIKLSHVILMNMKFKSQPSWGKKKKKRERMKKVERERVRLVGGESVVKRKCKSLHRGRKVLLFFVIVYLLLLAIKKILIELQARDQI